MPSSPRSAFLYAFEHITLREEAFLNHPELLLDLTKSDRPRRFWHAWAAAEGRCIRAGMIAPDALDGGALDGDFDALSVRGFSRGGHTVYVITLPPPTVSPEAHYAAVLHRDGEPHRHGQPDPSTRYLTLEKAGAGAPPMLCGWTIEGTHQNFGPCEAETEADFARAVLDWAEIA